jgi:hypothetical protein
MYLQSKKNKNLLNTMPQSPLTSQFYKEKPTYRVRCLYSSFVHGCTLWSTSGGGGVGGLTLVLLPGNETDPCQSAPQDDVIIEKKTILFFNAKEIFPYRHSLPENGV